MSTNPGPENWGQQQPQQPPPGGGFPAAPPPPPHAPAALGPVPKSLDLSVKIWFVAAGLAVLNVILSIATNSAINSELVARGLPSGGSNVGGIIFNLLLIGLWVFFVLQMKAGQNWARITLTVVGGIVLLFSLIGLLALGIFFAIGFFGALYGLLSLVNIALLVGAIYFQFRPDANAFFVRR
ncbi:hypothetical protein AB5J62_03230 [Amycolatopsis sp. cg5]|uniref:hypothetical protein n=1 Tax=Amycolatopsis sp. cg5 TaxID=3238802 RepID=UPI003525BDBB